MHITQTGYLMGCPQIRLVDISINLWGYAGDSIDLVSVWIFNQYSNFIKLIQYLSGDSNE
jgi:hypothetical protein